MGLRSLARDLEVRAFEGLVEQSISSLGVVSVVLCSLVIYVGLTWCYIQCCFRCRSCKELCILDLQTLQENRTNLAVMYMNLRLENLLVTNLGILQRETSRFWTWIWGCWVLNSNQWYEKLMWETPIKESSSRNLINLLDHVSLVHHPYKVSGFIDAEINEFLCWGVEMCRKSNPNSLYTPK